MRVQSLILAVSMAVSTAVAETPDHFLDYVESTGSQFVDTGIRPATGTKAEVIFSLVKENQVNNDNFDVLLGSSGTGGYFYYGCLRTPLYLGAGIGSKRAYCDTNTKYGFADSCSLLDARQVALGTKYTITTALTPGRYAIETKGGRIDGGFAYHTSSVGASLASENTLYLFASNHNGQPANTAVARIYGVKIWQTDSVTGTEVLVRDLKPCRKNGRAGLYDEVSQTILYSGAPDDLDPSYRPVSYIESTGAQYINTGIIPKTGTKTEVTVKINASPKSVVVVMGSGKQSTAANASPRFWMPAIYDWYLYAGCGRVSVISNIRNQTAAS